MRLGRSASGEERRKDKKLGRKKHKKLDAICEKEYSRSHSGVGRVESSECNVGEDEAELRRSARVRRAPVLLDTSPPPAKKRRKIDKRSGVSSVDSVKREGEVKRELARSVSGDLEEGSGGWRSRLRSRARSVGFRVREKENLSPKGKRKLFDEFEGAKEDSIAEAGEFDEIREGVVLEKSTVVKSQRPGRIKASNVSGNEHQEIDVEGPMEDDKESSEREVLEVRDEGDTLLLCREIECGDDRKVSDDDAPLQLVDIGKNEVEADKQLEECQGKDKLETVEQDMQAGEQTCTVGVDQTKPMEVDESTADRDKDGGTSDKPLANETFENLRKKDYTKDGGTSDKPLADETFENLRKKDYNKDGGNSDKPLANETFEKLRKKDYMSDGPPGKLQIKEGRHCGLCGTGNDGKPPKKMMHDGAGSDSEAYSGSSASEEPTYDIWDGFGDEPGWVGRLLGPINDRFGIAGIWVHQQCAVWSPEVYFAGLGCLKNVRAALCRGRVLKCSRCGRPGATIGCRVDRCPKTYHLPCARANGCIFDHRKFLIACTDHRHLFQPEGTQYFDRLKKMKAKKMKLEVRKTSNDAWRKDVEAEEKWLENCGEDEEFLKRESKRLHRDLLRIAPTYIGGSSCNQEMQFEGWESVAGLQNVIQCMKEVVILPLLYPEFFNNLGLTPPRGVLLHGYPGTGKTLVVRALIGSCARGDKRIAYFARKGADCLGKYVGDAERQLRLLFQVAEKSQPSIIFFDEIDGLAPSRTRQQDQTHSSVVSTLLALMDGLKSRGSVVVIGATNRPDAVDPALRRPGRFDREIYFPLPSVKDREAILSLHTQKWPKPVTGSLLKYIATKTVGFAGADLQALCTQAVIIALRRRFPLQKLLSTAAEKTPHGQLPPLPAVIVEERDWLEALSCAPPPCSRREAGMAANNLVSSPLPTYLVPCLLQPLSRLLVSLYLDERVWLPPPLSKAATLIENVIVSSLDEKKMKRDYWGSHAHDLLQETNITSQIEDRLRSAGIVIGDTCFGDDKDDGHSNLETSKVQCTRPGLLQNTSFASRKKSGFRILISGNPRSGQRHLASCLLHYFVGNVEVQKVDLATISQEGHGDMVQGLTQVLMRCASLRSCMIFMPRIDLWAIEISNEEYNQESHSSPAQSELSQETACSRQIEIDKEDKLCPNAELADSAEPRSAVTKASYLWNSFIEQVDSICLNTPLMILATSELQFSVLPSRIRQFFKPEILRGNLPTPMGDTVPQFLVEVDGNFDCDMVFDSCAVKLSKDLAQHFVQMQQYRNHIHVNSFEDKFCDKVQENVVAACLQSDPVSATGPEGKLCSVIPDSSALLGNVSVKGKSSLLLAISTFGYQILLYPHFAELCWVTSKLKEGPGANIHGPWKGWPFNSCIVRPINSVEKVAAVSGSGIIKIKEKSSMVRGLIAVGLSAYRGEYTSLREVASEVRKVLELLVGRINAKIQAGKDRCCYTRVMSQVAYLEDIVLSWAHTLQRLEVDAQPFEADSKLPCKASLDHESACKNSPIEGDVCKKHISNQILHESEELGKNPQDVNANNVEGIGLKGDGGIGHGNTFSEVTVQEGEKAQLLVSDSSVPVTHFQNSVQDGVDVELVAEAPENDMEAGEDSLPANNPNGFAETKSVNLTDDGPGGSGDQCSTQFCSCPHEDDEPLANKNVPSENITENTNGCNGDGNHSSLSTRVTPHSDIVCSYHCCSECLFNLHHLVKEILNRCWGLKGNHSAVEEVHDIVSCLSSKLHAAVRRLFLSENSSYSVEKKLIEAKYTKYCQEMKISPCNDSGRLPMECHCHPTSDSVITETKSSHCRLDLNFIFRDGVLATLDTNYNLSFHCNFKTLCLCSLIEMIVMSKEHLE